MPNKKLFTDSFPSKVKSKAFQKRFKSLSGEYLRYPEGIQVKREDLDKYILLHELRTNFQLKHENSTRKLVGCYKVTYACNACQHCPFQMCVFKYEEFPELAFIILIRGHVHAGPVQKYKKPFPELCSFLQTVVDKPLQAIKDETRKFIQEVAAMDDIIGREHRLRFADLTLPEPLPIDPELIIPSDYNLRNRIRYHKKIWGMLHNDEQPTSEQRDISATSHTPLAAPVTRDPLA